MCSAFGGIEERDWRNERVDNGSGDVDGGERGVGGAWLLISFVESRLC